MGSKENKIRWRWNNPENNPKAGKKVSGTKAKQEKSNERWLLL